MKHNVYADGNIQNIEFTNNTTDKSIGVVEPGEYILTPDREETIKCLTGLIKINNTACEPGQEITVEKDKPFTISAEETSSYICSYN